MTLVPLALEGRRLAAYLVDRVADGLAPLRCFTFSVQHVVAPRVKDHLSTALLMFLREDNLNGDGIVIEESLKLRQLPCDDLTELSCDFNMATGNAAFHFMSLRP